MTTIGNHNNTIGHHETTTELIQKLYEGIMHLCESNDNDQYRTQTMDNLTAPLTTQ